MVIFNNFGTTVLKTEFNNLFVKASIRHLYVANLGPLPKETHLRMNEVFAEDGFTGCSFPVQYSHKGEVVVVIVQTFALTN